MRPDERIPKNVLLQMPQYIGAGKSCWRLVQVEGRKKTIADTEFANEAAIMAMATQYGDDLLTLAATVDKKFATVSFQHTAVGRLAEPLIKIAKKRKRQRDSDDDDTKSAPQKPRNGKKKGKDHCHKYYRRSCVTDGQCPDKKAHHDPNSKSAAKYATTDACPKDIKAIIEKAQEARTAFIAFAQKTNQCPNWLRQGSCKYLSSNGCRVGGAEAHKPEYRAKLGNANRQKRYGKSNSSSITSGYNSSSSSRQQHSRGRRQTPTPPVLNGCYTKARGLKCPDPCTSGREHSAAAVEEAEKFLRQCGKHTCKYNKSCRYPDCRLFHPYSSDGTNKTRQVMALTQGVRNVTLQDRHKADLFHDATEATNHYRTSSSSSSFTSSSAERMLVALGKAGKPAYHADKKTGTLYEITAKAVGDINSPDKSSSRFKYD